MSAQVTGRAPHIVVLGKAPKILVTFLPAVVTVSGSSPSIVVSQKLYTGNG